MDQEALVYGPKAGCMVDQVYLSFLGHGLRALGSCVGGRRGRILYFLLGVLPPVMCSLASSRNGSGVQLWWEKAFPCHGNYNGGVRAIDGASYVTGHGERRLEHNRRARMAWVQRHWPVLWCVWVSQCSSGHVGQVEGSSRASGGFGHGDGLSIMSAASVWGLWPWRVSQWGE